METDTIREIWKEISGKESPKTMGINPDAPLFIFLAQCRISADMGLTITEKKEEI